MKYAYLLRSISHPQETYIGSTENLRARFAAHNAGGSIHTNKFKPWRLVAYMAFSEKNKALAFEQYLKTASGRAFASKRFW